jgi:hypothetical protein
MNERIKELAEEAGLGRERWNSTEQFNTFLEKFAELILEECCRVIDGHHEPVYDGQLIKRYFGVE